MNKIDVLIGKELKIARLQKRLSQQQVADKLGVSRQIISAYETGVRSMNVADFMKICEVLDCDADRIIDMVVKITNE